MVSRPSIRRSMVRRIAVSGVMIPDIQTGRIVFFQVVLTLDDQLGVVCTLRSSQKIASMPDNRDTGDRQFDPSDRRIFGQHIRQMSPFSTLCSSRIFPLSSTTRTMPSDCSSKVLSCEPYSSRLLGHQADIRYGAHGLDQKLRWFCRS